MIMLLGGIIKFKKRIHNLTDRIWQQTRKSGVMDEMCADSQFVPGEERNRILCKTIRQYNKEPVPAEVMTKLLDVAKDYRTVKIMYMPDTAGSGAFPNYIPAIPSRMK